MSAQEVMSATSADTNEYGGNFYFHPDTMSRGAEAGLNGFALYILGRGGMMGDIDPSVVQSAFGYFNPELIAKLWSKSIEKVSAREAAALYWDCMADYGRTNLSEVSGLSEYCAAAETVLAAAEFDAMPLAAGIAAMPLAKDDPARAYQLLGVLRELRGGAHLIAVRAVGISPKEAHALKRPEMVEPFGWKNVAISDGVGDKLDQAEVITDLILTSAYSALDGAGEAALVKGTAAIAAACE